MTSTFEHQLITWQDTCFSSHIRSS